MRTAVYSLVIAAFLSIMNAVPSERCYADPTLPISGKGMFVWQMWTANGGGKNLDAIISKLKSNGISWLVFKMGDGDSYYNQSGKSLYNWATTNYGSLDNVVQIFHDNGIKVVPYQYVYGAPHKWNNTWSETDVANWILDVKGVDGLVIDAEIEYDQLSTRNEAARSYCDSILAHHPGAFLALTAWSRPNSHPTFPWASFLERVAVNMPQAYWGARPTTVSNEMNLMSTQFAALNTTWLNAGDFAAVKPMMPIGDGYSGTVVQGDIAYFCSASQSTYHYSGISLWEFTKVPYTFMWDEYAASWMVTSAPEEETQRPLQYGLGQNFPNPFNPSTTINYRVQAPGRVTLKVYDMVGREVATLVDGQKASGSYSVQFEAPANASGMYFYTLQAGSYVETRKMVVMK